MSGNEAKTDRRQLRNYLLGQLPEDLAIQFDSRLFADDALREELKEEQNSIIEDFIYQRLTEEDERKFKEQIAKSPLLREKVASLRVLLSALERQGDPSRVPSFLKLKQMLTLLSPALALLLCLTAFLYVRERHRNTSLISQKVVPSVPAKDGAPTSLRGVPLSSRFFRRTWYEARLLCQRSKSLPRDLFLNYK